VPPWWTLNSSRCMRVPRRRVLIFICSTWKTASSRLRIVWPNFTNSRPTVITWRTSKEKRMLTKKSSLGSCTNLRLRAALHKTKMWVCRNLRHTCLTKFTLPTSNVMTPNSKCPRWWQSRELAYGTKKIWRRSKCWSLWAPKAVWTSFRERSPARNATDSKTKKTWRWIAKKSTMKTARSVVTLKTLPTNLHSKVNRKSLKICLCAPPTTQHRSHQTDV
jgi:hypothetical protein